MKKILLAVIVVVMSVCMMMFSACSKPNVLVVGTSPDFAPFEFYDDDNNITGFDIELMKAIGVEMNIKIEFREYEFEGILSAIPNTIDVGISAFTINDERAESVLFSKPYIVNEQVLVVKSGNTAFDGMSKAQIDAAIGEGTSVKLGACDGYVGYDYALEVKNASETSPNSSNLYAYKDLSLAIIALKANSIDAFIMDKTPAMTAAANDSSIKIIDVTLVSENYGIAMALNNTELKAKIDAAIDALTADGTIATLEQKWLYA